MSEPKKPPTLYVPDADLRDLSTGGPLRAFTIGNETLIHTDRIGPTTPYVSASSLEAATTRAEAAERENERLRKALEALGIVPPDSILDAVDDDELTGRRTLELDPLPGQRHRTRVTIALARQIRAALSAARAAKKPARGDHE